MAQQNPAVQTVSLEKYKIEKLEHVQINDLPVPEPKEGEVLVRITLRPVNPTDLAQAKGGYGNKPVFTVGSEGVGVVEKVGPGVKGLKEGQRVTAGGWPDGTWQRYIAVPEAKLVAVPDKLDDKTAAQFYINPVTAVGLLEVSDVPKGGWLLQTAAGSVLGRQVVQYAKHIGVKTISVVRRQSHVEELKALGADEVINMETEDIVSRVKEITGGKGADAAVDPVGGEFSGQILPAIKRGGTLRLFGQLAGDTVQFRIRDIMGGRNVSQFIIYSWLPGLGETESRKRLEYVLKLLEDGVITPHSGETYPFKDFRTAMHDSVKPGRGAKLFLEG